jgi:DNA-binding transcriptional MerR regulator
MSGLMVTQASQILRCHPNTLKRWERRGLINSSRDVNNWRRFDMDEVLRLKKLLDNRGQDKKDF